MRCSLSLSFLWGRRKLLREFQEAVANPKGETWFKISLQNVGATSHTRTTYYYDNTGRNGQDVQHKYEWHRKLLLSSLFSSSQTRFHHDAHGWLIDWLTGLLDWSSPLLLLADDLYHLQVGVGIFVQQEGLQALPERVRPEAIHPEKHEWEDGIGWRTSANGKWLQLLDRATIGHSMTTKLTSYYYQKVSPQKLYHSGKKKSALASGGRHFDVA